MPPPLTGRDGLFSLKDSVFRNFGDSRVRKPGDRRLGLWTRYPLALALSLTRTFSRGGNDDVAATICEPRGVATVARSVPQCPSWLIFYVGFSGFQNIKMALIYNMLCTDMIQNTTNWPALCWSRHQYRAILGPELT
jgi:hypothetical protein